MDVLIAGQKRQREARAAALRAKEAFETALAEEQAATTVLIDAKWRKMSATIARQAAEGIAKILGEKADRLELRKSESDHESDQV